MTLSGRTSLMITTAGDSNDKKRPGYENYDITTHTPRRQKSAVFDQEPLYQWYAADQIMRISGSVSDSDAAADSGSSSYENVERILQRAASISAEDEEAPVSENTVKARRTVIREVFSQTGSLLRAMWFEMPEVVDSGVLQFMSDQEKQAQEAMFEIITSEASYHKSLGVLESVFIRSAELSPDGNEFCIISKDEFQHLFSNILDIRRISAEFLADLEARWQESHVITDICDIIAAHAKKNFKPYIQYCGYQAFQDQTLKRLLKRTDFAQAVRRLERHHDCQCLPLASFLMLPMQRITRLPLLVDAVQHRVDPMSPQHATAKEAFIQLQSLVKKCNEEAKKMEQTQQMLQLRNKMKFGDTKEFPLVSQSRYLEKEGELKRITADATMRFPFSRDKPNSRKEPLYIFLFSDILVVTKKRGDKYIVQDYCPRQHLDTQIITSKEATWLASSYSFLLTLNSNHLGEKVELLLSADTE
nr:hypothetical protein BaRGS_031255 [Batillaria attramentaria]